MPGMLWGGQRAVHAAWMLGLRGRGQPAVHAEGAEGNCERTRRRLRAVEPSLAAPAASPPSWLPQLRQKENCKRTARRKGELPLVLASSLPGWITARESVDELGGTAPALGVLPTRAEPEAGEQFPQSQGCLLTWIFEEDRDARGSELFSSPPCLSLAVLPFSQFKGVRTR